MRFSWETAGIVVFAIALFFGVGTFMMTISNEMHQDRVRDIIKIEKDHPELKDVIQVIKQDGIVTQEELVMVKLCQQKILQKATSTKK